MFTRNIVRTLRDKKLLTESVRQRIEADADTARKAYQYARLIIQGRWAKGEPIIAQDAKWSYYYAHNILQGRFEEGEEEISYSATWFKEYWNGVLKRVWPDPLPNVLERARERYASILNEGPGMILPPWEDRQ